MNFKDLTYLDSLVEKFEREKTSCLPRLLSTSTISSAPPSSPPPPPSSLHPILYFTTSVETQTGSLVRARCIGKIIGITFLVQKRTRFLLSFLHHSFLFQRIPFFHEIFLSNFQSALLHSTRWIPNIKPQTATFLHEYANDFAHTANPVSIPDFYF